MAEFRPAKIAKAKFDGRTFYKVLSKDTNQLYISEDECGYVFESLDQGNKFCEEHQGTKLSTAGFIDFNWFYSTCLCIGIKSVIINGNEKDAAAIVRDSTLRNYINPELTKNVNLLLETGKVEYLEAFSDKEFIVPAFVISAPVNGFTKHSIKYGIMKANKDPDTQPVFYVAFTDLDEFEAWRKEKRDFYEPLKVKFWQLMEIVGESGLCINPGEMSTVFLTEENLRLVKYDVPETIVL